MLLRPVVDSACSSSNPSPTDTAWSAGVLLVLGVVAANVGKAHAGTNTWTSNGPYQVVQVLTDVRALAVDPTTPGTVYAGTYGSGVYKSTDKGSSWMQRSRGLGNQRVWALAWLLHTGVGHRGNS